MLRPNYAYLAAGTGHILPALYSMRIFFLHGSTIMTSIKFSERTNNTFEYNLTILIENHMRQVQTYMYIYILQKHMVQKHKILHLHIRVVCVCGICEI